MRVSRGCCFYVRKTSTASSKKGPAWAESTRLRLPLELLKQSLNLEESIAQELPKSNFKFSTNIYFT